MKPRKKKSSTSDKPPRVTIKAVSEWLMKHHKIKVPRMREYINLPINLENDPEVMKRINFLKTKRRGVQFIIPDEK